MRPYSVYDVHRFFWFIMGLSFGIGAIVRGCSISDRNDAIVALTLDAQILRAAEGRPAQGEDAAATLIVQQIKELQKSPEFAGRAFGTLLEDAKQLKEANTATIERFDPERWKKLQPLADLGKLDTFDRFMTLSGRYPMQELLDGKKTASETITVPPSIPWWSAGFWMWFYLAGSTVFVIALSLYKIVEGRKHPVRQFPWNRVDAVSMVVLAAPATAPALAFYGFSRLLSADWTKGLPKVSGRLRTLAYQARLLRRPPKPTLVIAPADLNAAWLDTQPATAEVIARHDEESTLWYVIAGETFIGLSSRLKEKGIDVYPITLKEPREMKGYAVQTEDIGAFEKAVGLEGLRSRESDTDIDRTVLLDYDRRCGRIEMEGVPDDKTAEMRNILRCVSAFAGGVDIVFAGDNVGETIPPAEGGGSAVVIYHCATPAEPARRMSYGRCFGRDFTGKPAQGFAPAEGLGSVICDEDGVPVAQVAKGTVYTLVQNMIQGPGEWRREALASVLHNAVAESRRQVEAIGLDDDLASAEWRRDIERHREKYAEISFGRLEKTRQELEAEIEALTKRTADLGKDLTATIRAQREKEKRLDAFMRNEWSAEKDRLMKEYTQLAASKYVLSVQVGDYGIEVLTRTVHIEHLGKRYRIGRFKLRLRDTGGVDVVNVANTAPRDVGYDHPHVRTNGYVCWGNMHQSIAKLMAERSYAVVVNMIFRFLESYNPHSGVANISNWKEVS